MNHDELHAFFANDRFATDQCGIRIVEARDGYAKCRMPLTSAHLNANGFAQGGAIFTLCDFAFAVAANAGDAPTVSLSCSITFSKPGVGSALTAEATELAATRKTSLYEVRVCDDQAALIAVMTVNGFRKG